MVCVVIVRMWAAQMKPSKLLAGYVNNCRLWVAYLGSWSPGCLLSCLRGSRSHGTRAHSFSSALNTVPSQSGMPRWYSRIYGGDGLSRHCGETSARWMCQSGKKQSCSPSGRVLLQGGATWHGLSFVHHKGTEAAPISSVAPTFVVMRFDQHGTVTSFEKKKTELCQDLSLQARDLRFQHSTSLTTRNNCIIIRMEALKAIVTPQCLLVMDFRAVGLERWLVLELAPQLASQTHTLPFEFRALEAILQHRVNMLQNQLNEVHPVILDVLESLVDPKILSADRSKLHVLLQNSKSLSELETDIKVFKDSLLRILDEDEIIEEMCLTKWSDPIVLEENSLGIDHAEEMELLLENYYMQAEELGNTARELKGLIDDSESVIFINLDSHRNVMMRLNLQLTMGTFSLSLFGLIGVAFGMNLESTFEEDPRFFWLVTGIMFLGSGLIWRRLLSFLGRHLEPSAPPPIPPVWKRNLKASDIKNVIR